MPTVNFIAGSKLSTTQHAEKKAQVLAAVESAGAGVVGGIGLMAPGVNKDTSDQVEVSGRIVLCRSVVAFP